VLTSDIRDHLPLSARTIERSPSQYSTSFPIDDITVILENGDALSLVTKDLRWTSLLPEARATKPRFLYDPHREIGVYHDLLDPDRFGTARYYGTLSNDDEGRYALVLERVPAVPLTEVGDRAEWERAACWLAGFHAAFANRVAQLEAGGVPLLLMNATFFYRWAERARLIVRDPRLEWLVARYDTVVDRLLAIPRTFVHGEFYPSNVLVGDGRVCPIDWEMAALGPGLLDLAALTAGENWNEDDRTKLVDAYADHVDVAFLGDLDACRVHLAMQWLGWSARWAPPPELAHDWLTEALAAADRLGL
jgi:hypothetical protein